MLQQPLVLQPSEQFAWMPRGHGKVCSSLINPTNNSTLCFLVLYKRSCLICQISFGGQDSFCFEMFSKHTKLHLENANSCEML